MKTDTHPTNYRPVVFQDLNNNATFLVRSTAATDETIKLDDGNEYPLVKVHISSSSHPFYTGQEKLVDVEGRVDRFKARQEAAEKKKEALAAKAKKAQKKTEDLEVQDVAKVGGGSKQNTESKPKSDDSTKDAKKSDPKDDK